MLWNHKLHAQWVDNFCFNDTKKLIIFFAQMYVEMCTWCYLYMCVCMMHQLYSNPNSVEGFSLVS